MEGKTVILSLLIMSLLLTHFQVEATSVCCPTEMARYKYKECVKYIAVPPSMCASMCKCKRASGQCPPGYQNDIHENSGDIVNEYCNLGCASSVCGALTTLQNSDASSNVLSEAVKQCTKACSTVCSKGSTAEVKSA